MRKLISRKPVLSVENKSSLLKRVMTILLHRKPDLHSTRLEKLGE